MATSVSDRLERKLRDLPEGPGVYTFLDGRKRVAYVGKAKSLRKRVGSYFTSRPQASERLRRLVAEIRDVDWLVTASEVEALVLENSLIKKNRPKFNINLRDDKNFLHVRVTTSDPFPGIELVRQPKRDDDAYFGPFVPASAARKTMRLLAQHFGIRSCRGPIETKDHRGCLYWHIGQCLGPCAAFCTREEYDGAVKDALSFLRGNEKELRVRLEERMRLCSSKEDYERAAHYRDLLRLLDRGRERQAVASPGLEQQDAWGMHREGARAFLVVAFVREGLVRGRREFALRDVADIEDATLLGDAIRQYYHDAGSFPDEVLLPSAIDEEALTAQWLGDVAGRTVRLLVPQRGDKVERIAWATENARVGYDLRFARGEAAREAVAELAEALDLPAAPERIEGFDISNVQGSDIVASMVVFIAGEPARREYRKFKIRTVSGAPDDFRAMHEVILRRYRRVIAEGLDMPDLVVVDGGKGQLSAAADALRELELDDLPLASIAKQEELLFKRGEPDPIRLERSDPALQLVQRLRDEAHRFAVSFHRQQRRDRTIVSALDAVPGIGPVRRRKLLREFGSVEAIKAAPLEQVAAIVGDKVARSIRLALGP